VTQDRCVLWKHLPWCAAASVPSARGSPWNHGRKASASCGCCESRSAGSAFHLTDRILPRSTFVGIERTFFTHTQSPEYWDHWIKGSDYTRCRGAPVNWAMCFGMDTAKLTGAPALPRCASSSTRCSPTPHSSTGPTSRLRNVSDFHSENSACL
jgi:hypothetical protein